MDLYGYIHIDLLEELLPSRPPRLRGIRLMKVDVSTDGELPVHDKYVGQDVINVHTRCGSSNYKDFHMDEWEEGLGDLLLEAHDEDYDCTYRDTYIKVPEDKKERYLELLKVMEEDSND